MTYAGVWPRVQHVPGLGGVVVEGNSFEAWYEGEHARLIASLVLVAGDLELARDAVDEACLRAFMRWPRVGAMASPSGYVYKIALHEVFRRQRRTARERQFLAWRARVGEVPPPAGEAWELVRALPPRQRAAIVLRYVSDLTEPEIARVLGVSRGTVSSNLADARRALARQLAADDDLEHDHG